MSKTPISEIQYAIGQAAGEAASHLPVLSVELHTGDVGRFVRAIESELGPFKVLDQPSDTSDTHFMGAKVVESKLVRSGSAVIYAGKNVISEIEFAPYE